MCLLGRGFHVFIKNVSFFSSTDVGSRNPPPSGPNILALSNHDVGSHNPPPRDLHALVKNVSFPSPIDVGSHNPPPRGFHTLIKNASFSSPTNVGFHNPPPSKPRILVETRSFFQSTWISQFYWWSCLYIFLKTNLPFLGRSWFMQVRVCTLKKSMT